MTDELNGKKVLVIGLGRSGVAAARFAASRGAIVTVSEKKKRADVEGELAKLSDLPISYSFGGNDPQLMDSADLIVLSPGVPITIGGVKSTVPIIGELELAVREIKTPMIAVTGTNGKTTTATLIGHLLSECGIKNCVGGNIGTALTELINDAKNVDWVVVEVSSFQLETTPSLKPSIGVLLNITPDHLNRHTSFEEYVELKMRLLDAVGGEGIGIYNAADEVILSAIRKTKARTIPFWASKQSPSPRPSPTRGEGVSCPSPSRGEGEGGGGGWFEGQSIWTSLSANKKNQYHLGKVRLNGAHNRENMLASVIVAELCGGEKNRIQRGLETFKGLPHRIEFVGEYRGVKYYDDSKGTNVGATVAALENFDGPVILIAGGLDKGASYAPLAPLIKDRVKRLVLVGEAKQKIKKELGNLTETVLADTMEDAVGKANQTALGGDVVLLSPACASFDMFRDYAERGEVFVNAIKSINHKDTKDTKKN